MIESWDQSRATRLIIWNEALAKLRTLQDLHLLTDQINEYKRLKELIDKFESEVTDYALW